jgi:hypothetical protein
LIALRQNSNSGVAAGAADTVNGRAVRNGLEGLSVYGRLLCMSTSIHLFFMHGWGNPQVSHRLLPFLFVGVEDEYLIVISSLGTIDNR